MARQKSYRVAWLLMGAARGSGGFRTVLVNAKALASVGITSHLYFYDKYKDMPLFACDVRSNSLIWKIASRLKNQEAKIRSKITRMGIEPENIHLGWDRHADEIAGADAVFATTWDTAYGVERLNPKGKKIHFLQAREDIMNPMGENLLLARNIFYKDFHFITIGQSLCHSMQKDFDAKVNYFDFGANLSIYKPLKHIKKQEESIVFVYQPKKTDRCARIGLEALRLVKQARPHVKVFLYGSLSHQKKYHIPFEAEHLGLLNVEKCNELYNRASVGLCFSANNPSRISFEMMATGLPVIELYGENTTYLFPDEAMLLAHPSPEAVAKAIIKLLDDKKLRNKMGQAGIEFMQSHNQQVTEVGQFCDIVQAVIEGREYEQPAPKIIYKGNKII